RRRHTRSDRDWSSDVCSSDLSASSTGCPYPWYADGYKLIETPHLGMEHQSGVAYGNHFLNGYLGRDLSRTGLGLQWDFIIVHERSEERRVGKECGSRGGRGQG